jgi:hypothetical protein
MDNTATIPAVSEPDPLLAMVDATAAAAANDEAPGIEIPNERPMIEIGHSAHGPTEIDLARLLKTRMVIQAGSGGGKSWALRRFTEQAYGKVHMIVVDPEGELVTLADAFGFTVCRPGCATNPIYAHAGAAAARAIYSSGRSTILSLAEFDGVEEMQRFVADFCRELLRMPPETWHHVIVVFDEAQLLAPQKEKAASKRPMGDLARRGRKRGMCVVAAIQRLSELDKGVAGFLENSLIGVTSLEIDIVGVAKSLGMRLADARQTLRMLPNGHFLCFGPALSYELVQTKIGYVTTRHGSLDEYCGVAAAPTMSAEALGELLKASRPAEDVDPGEGEGVDAAGQAGAARQPRRSAARARRPGALRSSRRGEANLERSIDVACEIVHGREIADLAHEHQVTDQSVRNWLHAAVGRIDLGRLGIVAEPLRVEQLRSNRHRVDTALRRAKLNARRAVPNEPACPFPGDGGRGRLFDGDMTEDESV